MTGQKYPVIDLLILIGTACIGCSMSAVLMQVDTYRISLEKGGTPLYVFGDFSARCNAEARAKNPCDNLSGSKKLHCKDSQAESLATCLASIKGSEVRSSSSAKLSAIRFNLPPSTATRLDTVRSAESNNQTLITVQSGDASLSPSILCIFGARC
jgi:hypothetical protein